MEKSKIIAELKKRMDGGIAALDHDLKGLRAGRASSNLLDSVTVEAYGDRLPLSQLATVSVPEARLLLVQVWDKSMVKAVEKGISHANLGVTTSIDGQIIRVPLPNLSEERRKELVKIAHSHGEKAKVSLRNVRRDVMDMLKKLEKDGELAQDEHRAVGDEVQKTTDDYVKKVEHAVASKEREVLQV